MNRKPHRKARQSRHQARVRAAEAAIRNLGPDQLRAQREWLRNFWQEFNAPRALALLRGTHEERQEGQAILAANDLTEEQARRLVRKARES
jgi:hypothetical protein